MDFKAIVKEQREELEAIERKENIITRGIAGEANKFLKHPNILAVTGIRRCGKSIASYLLAKGHNFGYINFDDERLVGTATEDLNKILQTFYEMYGDIEYLLLDEIQNISGWELFANRMRRTKKVIVTGSNSKLLSGELATHLTGRYIDITLYPFSFAEFLELKQPKSREGITTKEKAHILSLLRQYLEFGGFPEVDKFGEALLPRIYDDIIVKDVLVRRKIKNGEGLKKLSKYLITNFCSEISYSRLGKAIGIKHVSTVSKWVSYLEEAFLIFRVEKFDFKLKQQFISPKKIYCVDNGLVNAISFRFSENFGSNMENCVAIALQRCKALNSYEVYYWKDYQQNEVDFVVKQGEKIKQLIQVTYAGSREEIKDREVNALLKASKQFGCKDLMIITWDYEGEEKIKGKGIIFMPLWKWLLQSCF